MQEGAILVYGYGNPGRKDDGLGPAFIQLLDEWLIENPLHQISTDCNYQLNIEDAAAIADKEVVVFVDASLEEDIDAFSLTKVEASTAKVEFSMHAVSPAFVLDLCEKMYDKSPETWLLHIRGYDWDFIENLSDQAEKNLHGAFQFLLPFLREKVNILINEIP